MNRRTVVVPVAAVGVLVALKLLTLDVLLDHRPDALDVVNVVEPWKAPFAQGDERWIEGDLPAAETEFRTALAAAPDDGSRCTVRVNLALTVLRQAEAAANAGTLDVAVPRFTEAAEIADAGSGNDCSPADEETLRAAAERARDALVRAQLPDLPGTATGPATPPATDASPAQAPTQDQLDQVARDAQVGAADRAAQGTREEFGRNLQDGPSLTPW